MAKRIKRVRKVPATTNNLTKAIVNFLLAEGHSASRINTQGNFRKDKNAWTKSGSRRGVSDIIGALAPYGKAISIEIKINKDKLRPDQIEYRKEFIKAGGIFLEIKSYDKFLTWYKGTAYSKDFVEDEMPGFGPIYTEYTPPKK